MNFLFSNYQITSLFRENGDVSSTSTLYINYYDLFEYNSFSMKYLNKNCTPVQIKVNKTPIRFDIESLNKFYFTTSLSEEKKKMVEKIIKDFYSREDDSEFFRSRGKRFEILLDENEKKNFQYIVENKIEEIFANEEIYDENKYGKRLIGDIALSVMAKSDYSKKLSLMEYCDFRERGFAFIEVAHKKEIIEYARVLFKKNASFKKEIFAKVYHYFEEEELANLLLISLFKEGE